MVAKIVLGLAIASMLATAYLGYMTRGKVLEVKDNLKTTSENLTRTQGTLDKTKGELKTSQDQTASEKARADGLTTELASAKTALDSASAQAKDLQGKLDEANKLVDTLRGGKPTEGQPSNPLEETITKLQGEVKDAQAKVAELEQVKVGLETRAKAAESKTATLEEKEQRRVAGTMRPGLSGQILAVNPGYGFVVLSLGDRQGAVMNAEMLVVRGEERIAKIRITSVEPSTSVADVVPGTAKRGVRIQPGDSVIYPGQ